MLSIIKSLIEDFIMIPSFNVVILGTQQTGKTRLFNLIKNYHNLSQYLTSSNPTYIPTVGLNTTNFKISQARLCVWDLGGKKTIRKIWQNYYPQSHAIIYFVDNKHEIALQQSLFTLKQVLRHNEMARIPIIILTSNTETIGIVRKFTDEQPELFYREFDIRFFQFSQVGMLSSPKDVMQKQQQFICIMFCRKCIKEIMTWLYKRVSNLRKQVDAYELSQ